MDEQNRNYFWGEKVKTVQLGLFVSSLILAIGVLLLPPVGLKNLESLFATSWVVLGLLVAAGFFVDAFKK